MVNANQDTKTVTATVVDDQIDEADQQLYKSKMLIDQAERQIFNDGGNVEVGLSAEFGQYTADSRI